MLGDRGVLRNVSIISFIYTVKSQLISQASLLCKLKLSQIKTKTTHVNVSLITKHNDFQYTTLYVAVYVYFQPQLMTRHCKKMMNCEKYNSLSQSGKNS